MKFNLILLAIAILAVSCSNSDLKNSENKISVSDLEYYVKNLGSDEFMGRKPFTDGEKITIGFLAAELKKIGFEPAFDGKYFQPVPMVEISSGVVGQVKIKTAKGLIALNAPDNIAVTSPRLSDKVDIKESDMIFAGFGIVAPEYNWNDYSGLDVKGKTVCGTYK